MMTEMTEAEVREEVRAWLAENWDFDRFPIQSGPNIQSNYPCIVAFTHKDKPVVSSPTENHRKRKFLVSLLVRSCCGQTYLALT